MQDVFIAIWVMQLCRSAHFKKAMFSTGAKKDGTEALPVMIDTHNSYAPSSGLDRNGRFPLHSNVTQIRLPFTLD